MLDTSVNVDEALSVDDPEAADASLLVGVALVVDDDD